MKKIGMLALAALAATVPAISQDQANQGGATGSVTTPQAGSTIRAIPAALCGPATAIYGSVPDGKCAPVNGAIPKRRDNGKCAGGMFGDPREGGARDHEGLDIESEIGSPVFAAEAGTVLFRQNYPGGPGLTVNVKHKDGKVSRYWHLSDYVEGVTANTEVAAGREIGKSGITGNATTTTCPHLHLELTRTAYPPEARNPQWSFPTTTLNPLKWLLQEPAQ